MDVTRSDGCKPNIPTSPGMDGATLFGLQNADPSSVFLTQPQPAPDRYDVQYLWDPAKVALIEQQAVNGTGDATPELPNSIGYQQHVTRSRNATSPAQGTPGTTLLNENRFDRAAWNYLSSSSPDAGLNDQGSPWSQVPNELNESQTTLYSSGIRPGSHEKDSRTNFQETANLNFQPSATDSSRRPPSAINSATSEAGGKVNSPLSPLRGLAGASQEDVFRTARHPEARGAQETRNQQSKNTRRPKPPPGPMDYGYEAHNHDHKPRTSTAANNGLYDSKFGGWQQPERSQFTQTNDGFPSCISASPGSPSDNWVAPNFNRKKRARALDDSNGYQNPEPLRGDEIFRNEDADPDQDPPLGVYPNGNFQSNPLRADKDGREFESRQQPKRRRLEIATAFDPYTQDPPDATDDDSEAEESNRRNGQRKTRTDHGLLHLNAQNQYVFKARGSGVWETTRYHEDVRRAMIDTQHGYGDYDHLPARGTDQDDLTAYHPEQRRWRCDGHHKWHPSQNSLLYRFEQRGLRDPDYEPGPLRFQGSVILNSKSQVITDWKNLPLTISSKVEGCRMENLQRQDSRLTVQDIMDRQPNFMATKRSALTQRTGRFRNANGLLSWNCRDGTQKYKTIMLRHLTRDQVSRNTTEGYDGLTKAELRQVEDDNKATGKYNARAGRNAKRR